MPGNRVGKAASTGLGTRRAGRFPSQAREGLSRHESRVLDLDHPDRGGPRLLHRHRPDTPLTIVRRFIRDHSLSLFFLAIFLASLVGLAIAGHALHNDDAAAHGGTPMTFWRYIVSSDFGNAVMENWPSEYLQF